MSTNTRTRTKPNTDIDVSALIDQMKGEETRGRSSTVAAEIESLLLSASPVLIWTDFSETARQNLTNQAQNAANYVNRHGLNVKVVRRISAGKVYVWNLDKLTPAQVKELGN